MADRSVLASEDVVGRDLVAVWQHAEIVAGVVAVQVGVEPQVPPAALLLEGQQLVERRAGHHGQRHALVQVRGVAVQRSQQRRAHRTGPLALRAEHVAVDAEGLLVAEQAGEIDGPLLALEPVVACYLPARRQGAALLGHAFEMAAQLQFLGQQRRAGGAVFRALVGKPNRAARGEFGGGG